MSSTGIFGLVAYPAKGVYKSVKTLYNPDAQEVLFARQIHGAYINTRYKLDAGQIAMILSAFEAARVGFSRDRKKTKRRTG